MNQSLRVVLAFNLLTFLLGLSPLYAPFENFAARILWPPSLYLVRFNVGVLGQVSFLKSLPGLDREKSLLKEQVLKLESLRVENSQLKLSNSLLKEQLKIRFQTARAELVLAKVIGWRSADGEIVLSAGEKAGLRVGNFISLKGVLVGRVAAVNAETSLGLLSVSPRSSLAAVTAGFKARGSVSGSFGNYLRLSKVLPSQEIRVGDLVIEPQSNLIVGQVDWVSLPGAKIFKEANLKIMYEPSLLAEVIVYLVEPKL